MHPGESAFSALQPPAVDTCTGGGKTDAGRRIPGPACAEVPRRLPSCGANRPAWLSSAARSSIALRFLPFPRALLPSAPAADRRPLPLALLPPRPPPPPLVAVLGRCPLSGSPRLDPRRRRPSDPRRPLCPSDRRRAGDGSGPLRPPATSSTDLG
ncbi:hypothetical protein PVAP13_5NG010300 [Panicum virgatum]|uniref:Uncharacterized protein n=1 Tax=Panicum virgatum TaxID=38727 RepID=A0A8T0SCY0_PANVG|nr:hypothetical protein PVAP13_5NG010300 [Panicum virgatum]